MKFLTLTTAIVLVSLTGSAQGWGMDKAHSKLGFTVTHLLVSDVDGTFKNFDLKITSSKDDFTDAVIEVTADIGSVYTDNDTRDNDLKSPKFFDVAQFPTLSFKSTSFQKLDEKNYKLSGDLTMHGITKPVVLDVVLKGTGVNPMNNKPVAGFKINGTIKRKDFEVGSNFSTAIVSDEVEIKANVELRKN